MKRLVVNYSSGGYLPSQRRLRASLDKYAVPHHLIYERVSGESGRYTPHSQVTYYFKAEVMREASKIADSAIWLDATTVVGGPLDPLFEILEQQGYLLFDNGWNNAQWCNDHSLAAFGFTRDEAERQPQCFGSISGLSSTHPSGRLLLQEYVNHRDLFAGRHDNRDRTESKDPRCLGHRHDQSVLSLAGHRHSLVHLPPDPWIYYGGISPKHLISFDGSLR